MTPNRPDPVVTTPTVNPNHPAVAVNPPPPGREAGAQNPFPYVMAFVIAVLVIWGVMSAFQGREETTPVTTQASVTDPVIRVTPFSQDTVETVEVTRVETPERVVVQAPSQESQIVVVETDGAQPTAPPQQASNAPVAAESSGGQAASAPAAPIEVVDLDYSAQLFPPLQEAQLDAALTQLDADIDMTESSAEAKSQEKGLEILEERFDVLEDRRQAMNSPLNEADRTELTRKIEELRAELTAFQQELAAR